MVDLLQKICKELDNQGIEYMLSGSLALNVYEDLILSKLIWVQELQSEKQIEDIKSLFENAEINHDYIRQWITTLNLKTFNLL